MVLFSALMMWSFSSKEYRGLRQNNPHTNSFMAFLHSLNYWDFIRDAAAAIAFFFNSARHEPHVRGGFEWAFGVRGKHSVLSSLNVDKQMNEVDDSKV